jgi:aminoglycoside 3-N-acetyltransferase
MKFNYLQKDIKNALKEVGINKGDSVFVHSNIGFFGTLEGAVKNDDYVNSFKEAFLSILEDSGTLIVPTFSYSFCRGNDFNPDETPSVCGVFSEAIRKDFNAIRSWDANFSIAAIGNLNKYYTKDSPEYSFGSNSFWDRFYKKDGKFCNLNFDAASTFIHYVERELKVPYRWDKPFQGHLILKGQPPEKRIFYHFVYDLEKVGDKPMMERFAQEAEKRGLIRKTNLGRGQVTSITAKDTFDLIRDKIAEQPRFLLNKL